MWIALVRKEIRLASDVYLSAAVLLFASFPLALIGVAMQNPSSIRWKTVVGAACVLNQYTMVLTGALLGAVAFAREREDANAAFIEALPIPRQLQFSAKAATALLAWLALWLLNIVVLILLTGLDTDGWRVLASFVPRMSAVAAVSFCAVGIAALSGCYIANSVGAAFTALGLLGGLAAAAYVARFHTNAAAWALIVGSGSLAWFHASTVFGREYRNGRRVGGSGAPTFGFESRIGWKGTVAALLWKDTRLMWPALIIGFVVFLLPFGVALGHAFFTDHAAPGLRTASVAAMAIAWCVAPFWAATSAGSEWPTSTHRFLDCLPVSTRRIVVLKLVVAGVPSLCLALVCAAVFACAHFAVLRLEAGDVFGDWGAFLADAFIPGAVAYECAIPVTFAVAWFAAGALKRRIVAVALGIVSGPAAMALWAVFGTPEDSTEFYPSPALVIAGYAVIVGAVCFMLVMAGTSKWIRNHGS